MKKIKKAAVLVPAFATVVLATVGSVTGTMAWFSANRTAASGATVFESKALSDSLSVTAAPNSGCTCDSSDVMVSGLLTHASYDRANDHLTTLVYENTPTVVGGITTAGNPQYKNITDLSTFGYANTTDNWTAGATVGADSKKIYYAVSWTYTFTYTFGGATKDQALFLDNKLSQFADTKTGESRSITGFRISFSNSEETKDTDGAFVLGGNTVKENYNICDGTTATTNTGIAADGGSLTNLGVYGTNDAAPYIACGAGTGTYADNQDLATYKGKDEYIGSFLVKNKDQTKNTASIKANCVAWFEGNDPNVADNKTNSQISAALYFYVRSSTTLTA